MDKWIVPHILIEKIRGRAKSSSIGQEPDENPGYLTLFNKNSMVNDKFANPQPCPYMDATIVEADEIPMYWKNVIKPYEVGRGCYQDTSVVVEQARL